MEVGHPGHQPLHGVEGVIRRKGEGHRFAGCAGFVDGGDQLDGAPAVLTADGHGRVLFQGCEDVLQLAGVAFVADGRQGRGEISDFLLQGFVALGEAVAHGKGGIAAEGRR